MFRMIRSVKYEFYPDEWEAISEDAMDFVRRLLVADPKKRMTWKDALEHPWMKSTAKTDNMAGTLEKLKQFNARRKWKAGINAVRAGVRIQRIREAIKESVAEGITPAGGEGASAP